MHLRKHRVRMPIPFQFFELVRFLVFAAFTDIIRGVFQRFDFVKYHLPYPAAHDERNSEIARVVRNFHSSTVEKTDIAPARVLAYFDEIAAERRTRVHFSRDDILSSDEFLRVRQNRFSGG